MRADGSMIAAGYAGWGGPRQPEEDIFGTGDPEAIAASVGLFCARCLGSPIEVYEFFVSGVLSVHGVRLADGRRVVVKAARHSFDSAFLAAVQTVQSHLAVRGFPCPKPVLEPTPLGQGIAVVEELLDRGARADGHDPHIRRQMAFTLARQIDLSRRFVSLDGLKPSLLASPRRRARRCGRSLMRRDLISWRALMEPSGSMSSP